MYEIICPSITITTAKGHNDIHIICAPITFRWYKFDMLQNFNIFFDNIKYEYDYVHDSKY